MDAFVLESYAVHFLQDFLAPGHVAVSEPHLAMAATLKQHDRINLEGKPFRLADDWRPYSEADPKVITSCLRLAPDAAASGRSQWQGSRQAQCIRLQGDGQLYSRGMGTSYRPDQAIFITEVVSASFDDVATVFVAPATDWRSLNLPPQEGPREERGFGVTPQDPHLLAWIPAGEYDNSDECRPPASENSASDEHVRTDPVSAGYPATGPPSARSKERLIEYRRDPIGSRVLTLLPRIAFDVTVERLNEESRKTIGAEVFLDCLTKSWVEYQTLEFSLGYTYVRGNTYDGQGVDGHVYYRFKNLYLWTSLGAGWRHYTGDGESANAPYVGGRVGFGPEILSVFTGVAVDSSFDRGRLDTDLLSFEFGVQSILPVQRIGAFLEGLADTQKSPPKP